jgi:hypothetical protein
MSDSSLDYAGYDGDERSRWERLSWINDRPSPDFGVSERPPSVLIIEPTPPVISVEISIPRARVAKEKLSSTGQSDTDKNRNDAEQLSDTITRASVVQGVMGVIFLLIGLFAITLIASGLQKVLLIVLAYGIPLGLGLLYWCLRASPPRNANA